MLKLAMTSFDVKYTVVNVNIDIIEKGPYMVKGKVNLFYVGGYEVDVKKSDCAVQMR
jgi:hypothetical protein